MAEKHSNPMFRSKLSEDIFQLKYAHQGCETWAALCKVLVEEVCSDVHQTAADGSKQLVTEGMSRDSMDQLIQYMTDMKFIAGGRYLYYANRDVKYYNNCYLLKAEADSREDWANLSWKLALSPGPDKNVSIQACLPQ